jgi:hypothetical protein
MQRQVEQNPAGTVSSRFLISGSSGEIENEEALESRQGFFVSLDNI